MLYAVIDRHTGLTVRYHRTRQAARRHADRLDLMYGAIRYYVRIVTA